MPGVVIRLGPRGFGEISAEGDIVSAGAAALDKRVAETAAAASLSGLEFLFGIPGTIGGALVRVAVDLARRRGAVVVRVDCWAGAPGLIAWYERQRFVCCGSFEQNGWVGQIFKMTV